MSAAALSPRCELNMKKEGRVLLFLFVEPVDKAALVELPNESHIDELFRFGVFGSGITLGNIIEHGFKSFQAGILLFRIHGFGHDVIVAFLQGFPVETAAHVMPQGFDGRLFIGPHFVHRFHVRSNIAAHRVRMFLEVLTGCRCAGVLKNQPILATSAMIANPFFSAMKLEGGLITDAVTRPVKAALNRSGPLPTWTRVASFPGFKPILRRANRAIVSVAEPNRLIATVPPLSCSAVLAPG